MGQVLLLFQVSPKKCDQELVPWILASRSIVKSHSKAFLSTNPWYLLFPVIVRNSAQAVELVDSILSSALVFLNIISSMVPSDVLRLDNLCPAYTR
jgi:hypothetical protein